MDSKPVFYDPKGRRATFVTRAGAFVGSLAAVLSTLCLLLAAFTIPYLPTVGKTAKPTALPGMPAKDLGRASFLTTNYRRQLADLFARDQRRRQNTKIVSNTKIVAGFYAPWETSGIASLRAHATALTHIVPQWLHLRNDGLTIDASTDFDPAVNIVNREVIKIATDNGIRVVPILDNFANGNPDPKRTRRLLQSPQAQKALALKLATFLDLWHFQGLNIDFEQVDASEADEFLGFLKILRAQFDRHGLSLSAEIEAESELPIGDIAAECDWVVLMDYDEHWEDGPAGPISSIDWSEQKLEKALETIPNEKLVMGIGNYAYDWTVGKLPAESLTFQEALTNAAGYRSEPPDQVIHFDEASLNNTFQYVDEEDKRHVVWMLDGVSAYNQWKAARDNEIRGAALWVLGSEDPSIWSFLDRHVLGAPMPVDTLKQIKFPYQISFSGRGEILSIESFPEEGRRDLTLDEGSGLISECKYFKYAFPYVIKKSGFIPKKLALTFDDGPDPQWTPQILQALKELHAPGTFFVIGNSCEQHPGLVGREYQEGHEVGNHSFFHPNMGAIGLQRDRLELNLTQIAIEAATGRSTIMFRPPYNADSEPSSAEEVIPMDVAAKMDYVTVAENIDPTDWDLRVKLDGGGFRQKTADDIVGEVERQIKARTGQEDEGNVILLHDAGGDRSATVAALRRMIPELRAQGYEFIPVSQMMGVNRDTVMPPPKDPLIYWVGRIVLGTTYGILWFLSVAFVAAIGLGLARVFIVTCLALWYRRGETVLAPADFQPAVSVVIAAYNEEQVIARTIESVLASRYPIAEVLVVDDGSVDGTSAAVTAAFGANPNVRLLQQENGGKASALNHGFSEAQGEFMFCIDADTQLDPDAIGLTVRHFVDEKVGAVAGNVRVGNEVNVITYWQSLEYTTSQNLDRRAYAMLNAITVVPGAIGAWRKSAVQQVGGYMTDTLAEDMDLTWRLRRAEWRITNEAAAYAYTEAPQSFRAFFRQRFRWAYGTLQCLFKHRAALFRYGWFGGLALPSLWLFQVLFQAIAPLVDVEVILSVVAYLSTLAGSSSENGSQAMAGATQTILEVGFLYAVFFVVELVAAVIATRLEKQRFSLLWWLFLQRFAYRQIMYGVIYRSIVRAVKGGRQGWGKVDRKGTVKVPRTGR